MFNPLEFRAGASGLLLISPSDSATKQHTDPNVFVSWDEFLPSACMPTAPAKNGTLLEFKTLSN